MTHFFQNGRINLRINRMVILTSLSKTNWKKLCSNKSNRYHNSVSIILKVLFKTVLNADSIKSDQTKILLSFCCTTSHPSLQLDFKCLNLDIPKFISINSLFTILYSVVFKTRKSLKMFLLNTSVAETTDYEIIHPGASWPLASVGFYVGKLGNKNWKAPLWWHHCHDLQPSDAFPHCSLQTHENYELWSCMFTFGYV